jgi:glycosyltransferase involved in cell wall biosynthesis
MKILQLCKKFPYPLKDGEAIAVTYLSRALHELGCEVSLLAMNTSKHYVDTDNLPRQFNHYKKIFTSFVDNRVKPFDAFVNLFSEESYNISRFVTDGYKKQLINLLEREDYDVIQLETLYLAPYIPIIRQYSTAKIVMRSHNIEHEIWERLSANATNPLKKWYLTHLTKKLKRFELEQLSKYDAMLAITQRDLSFSQELGYDKPAVVVPIGLDISYYTADNSCYRRPLKLSFIGSLDWQPNIEGLVWFLDNVWEEISAALPEVEFHIAGRNTPDWLKNLKKKNVFVHGEVPDAQEFINKFPLMVVPLLSGGGMRAKILEGMALGKVILSTSIGLEGIDADHEEHVLVADTPAEFVTALIEYQDLDKLLAIGQRAQVFTAKNYDNYEIAKKVLTFYKQLCGIKIEKRAAAEVN